VTTSSGKVANLIKEITAASDEQARGISQINVAVTQMNQVTQANAANAEESASASEEMSGQAETMNDLVDQMKVVVNGVSGNEMRAHKTHSIGNAAATLKISAKLASKPAAPLKNKATAPTMHKLSKSVNPEHVIPLDDKEALNEF
jgi:methyl-accepting chemotaxis protein